MAVGPQSQDIDDLDNISSLPEYIRQSNTILVFLSQGVDDKTGYLQSWSCCKELTRCEELRKPVILVYEPEVQMG